MNRFELETTIPSWVRTVALGLCYLFAASYVSAAGCDKIKSQPDAWVNGRVNALVLAAQRAYESDNAQTAYERVLDRITRSMEQCRLAQEKDFVERYPEFVGYVATLALDRQPDHELGFS